ncbi:MAG: RNA-binding transcriptional accessory protein [Clostridia bacterium]|nr:RNA-binding transcriptional accessory protein [Clostridia bacterium]
MDIQKTLAAELSLPVNQVQAAVELLDGGNTVPFIARYRKEVTGGLDDTCLRNLLERLTYLRNLEARKEEVRGLIAGMEKMTDQIAAAIDAAVTMTEVEDIYRPFRPKRRTRASIARERGLEPLADAILAQKKVYKPDLEALAETFVNPEKEVNSVEEAFAGAADIIAENVSDDPACRGDVRELTVKYGKIVCRQDKDIPVYAQYYDYSEALRTMPPHRVLAVNRGEKEEALKVSIEIDRDIVMNALFARVITNPKSPAYPVLSAAVCDGYDRLMAPSVEREIRSDLTDTASEAAIKNFSMNLRNLLLQPPLKGKTVIGYDPGYRTGCKLAVVTPTGAVAETAVIYPTKPHEKIAQAREKVLYLLNKYKVDVIAIGNGTASGESEMFIAETLQQMKGNVRYSIVSEAGASVYSASELGAEEFPDFDVTERSAVSIARRLQDPLAELVKIDPKSIGVGQYQHDMKPARLDEALSGVVEDCVNAVGVDLNTASPSLLSYIAGINKTSAKNIVKYREENGAFARRADVLKVPRFGAKAYEQAAGFLRVPGSAVILDNTGVHPESYKIAKDLCAKFGYTDADIAAGGLRNLRGKAEKAGLETLAAELGCGVPTLTDIIGELEKPGRDIRDALPMPVLREKVLTMEELTEGQILTGTVRNVVDFGAFVDIGVHEDGLVHISEITDRYIKHPSQVLSVGDVVQVAVKSVDLRRKRIGLTMKGVPGNSLRT